MRYAKRIDKNHVEIVNELRKRGIHAVNMTTAGDGICDIITSYKGKDVFIEIKFGKKAALKKTQLKFLGTWPGYAGIAKTVEDAINLATEPEKYALTKQQKDELLIAWATTQGPQVHLETILKVIGG